MAEVPRQASFTVLGGPMNGRQFVMDHAVDEVLIGSDPDCSLSLDVPGVSPIHARIWVDLNGATVHDTKSPMGLFVNDAAVEGQAALSDGDILWLGSPGAEGSVMVQCRIPPPGPAPVAAPVMLDAPPAGGDLEILEEPEEHGDEFFFSEPSPGAGAAPPAEPVEEFDLGEAPPPPAPAPEMPPFEEMALDAPEPESMSFDLGEPAPPAAPEPPPPGDSLEFDTAAPAPAADDGFFAPTEEPAPEAFAPPEADPFAAPAEADPFAAPPPEADPFAPAPDPFASDQPIAFDEPEPEAPAPAPPPPPPAPAPAPPPPVAAAPAPPPPPRKAAPRAEYDMPSMVPEGQEPAEEPAMPRPKVERPATAGTRPAAGKASRGGGNTAKIAIAAVVVLALAAGGFFARGLLKTPKVASIAPTRAAAGKQITITGENFASELKDNIVRFGTAQAKVVQVSADASRLQVEVPGAAATAGKDTPVPVVVVVNERESNPTNVTVYKAPEVTKVVPDVAGPGDEVTLTGSGWAAGLKVKFGAGEAEVVEFTPTTLKVKVPAIEAPEGTASPITVAMGADTSAPAAFTLGRLPLIASAEPLAGAPGDVVTLKGRGFAPELAANQVTVGGSPALVVGAKESELKVVVPFGTGGEGALELRVAGSEKVARGTFTLNAPDAVDFRFAAVPWSHDPAHDHAAVATALGPAFILSAAKGRSAAERAYEAQTRLNAAADPLRTTPGLDAVVRNAESDPVVALAQRPDPLLEVAAEDAAGYEEDWTQLKGKGGPVTRSRLAVWWAAVTRDLVMLLIRGEKPHFALDLAPEGKVFADVFAAARKAAPSGVPASVAAGAREGLRVAALRVPAAVVEPVPGAAAAAAPAAGTPAATATAAAGGPALQLDGSWTGSEVEADLTKYVTVQFKGSGGSFRYEGAVPLTLPVSEAQNQKGAVRFAVAKGNRTRYYKGTWDGQKLAGTIASDPGGKTQIGTFELSPMR